MTGRTWQLAYRFAEGEGRRDASLGIRYPGHVRSQRVYLRE